MGKITFFFFPTFSLLNLESMSKLLPILWSTAQAVKVVGGMPTTFAIKSKDGCAGGKPLGDKWKSYQNIPLGPSGKPSVAELIKNHPPGGPKCVAEAVDYRDFTVPPPEDFKCVQAVKLCGSATGQCACPDTGCAYWCYEEVPNCEDTPPPPPITTPPTTTPPGSTTPGTDTTTPGESDEPLVSETSPTIFPYILAASICCLLTLAAVAYKKKKDKKMLAAAAAAQEEEASFSQISSSQSQSLGSSQSQSRSARKKYNVPGQTVTRSGTYQFYQTRGSSRNNSGGRRKSHT